MIDSIDSYTANSTTKMQDFKNIPFEFICVYAVENRMHVQEPLILKV